MPDARAVAALVGEAHRLHWAEVLGATVRFTRDLDLAEECAQEAFVRALRSWPDAVPDNPAAWLTAVARREAVDRVRRETTLRRKLPLLVVEEGDERECRPTRCGWCSRVATRHCRATPTSP